jgi:hypothetical protein
MIVKDSVLTHWLATAVQGERLVYAKATWLTPNTVTRRLYDLAVSGHVVLVRERRADGGTENFRYIAQRTALPMAGGKRRLTGVRVLDAGRGKPQDKRIGARSSVVAEILPAVRGLLAEGEAANASRFARMLGVYSHEPVRRALERLAA